MQQQRRQDLDMSSIREFKIKQSLDWLRCGWRSFEKNPQLWIMIFFLYTLIILGCVHIPIMGTFVVAFFLPILTGGVFLTFERLVTESRQPKNENENKNEKKKQPDAKEQFSKLVFDAMGGLLGIFAHEHKIISAIQLSFVAVILAFLGQGIVHLLAAPMFLEHVQTSQLSAYQISMVVLAAITIIAFYIISIILFIYCIPLCIVRDEPVFESIYFSFAAVWVNRGAISVYMLILSLPILIAFLSVASTRVEGLILAGIIGTFGLPLIVGSMYCSYKLVYR